MNQILNFVHQLRRGLWRLLKPRTRGVKVMLFNEAGELLLVRHSYGRSDLFDLPGGGVRPWETPESAARREMREELGCTIERLTEVSTHFSAAEGKRDTITLFESKAGKPPTADGFEIEEARFFALDALPPNVSPSTLRRVAERTGQRVIDGSW